MMGQPIRGGTAFSQILLDDQMLVELLKSVDVNKNKGRLEQEEEGDLSRLNETDVQLLDPCSSTQFKMNMVLPRLGTVMEEQDVELIDY